MTKCNVTTEKPYAETPLMRQYNSIKAQHPDALLLFRTGDFYETFAQDAVIASSILGITLTKRANGSASSVPLAGFPYHALDTYLPKLVMAGQRVAICEQLEDPKKAKGIVKRGVTELVTPGVTYHDNILNHNQNSFLASVFFGNKNQMAGVAFLDISTGEFMVGEGSLEYIDKLVSNFAPKEIVYNRVQSEMYAEQFGDRYYNYKLDEWAWRESSNREKLLKQFSVNSLKGFGIESMPLAITAAGAVLYYLEYTEHKDIAHVNGVQRLDEQKYMWIDRYTIRNLELFRPSSDGGYSLADTLDRTCSPMGGRMLRRWLSLPLRDAEAISKRLDVVDTMICNADVMESIRQMLSQVGDMERLIAKVAAGRINPREVVQLSRSLSLSSEIGDLCKSQPGEAMRELSDMVVRLPEVCQKINSTIMPDPAIAVGRGASVVARGVSQALDELRDISSGGKDYLMQIQQRESEQTGIGSLKISYNNVFGYYIEVRNAHKDKVPQDWIRKQTLVNAERYITQELKDYEHKILGAEERIAQIEVQIFAELIEYLRNYISQIKQTAMTIAQIDALCGFACVSVANNYSRAEILSSESMIIDIKNGRHPVIEQHLPIGEPYIPNDVMLDDSTQQIIMITGPNMAGKSALLRQTAIIVLMAQIGCFVPASSARIGVVDRIFTRVGASDNISQGESTFMVEMLESANILNNVSGSSLVLLDEIGRGTSTYDGISIAWAMVEYLHEHPRCKPRTLFATHYHELNEMENQFERIRNYNVSVREIQGRIIFLRKLIRGGTEHSFGIHVAKIAGMPLSVVSRAEQILEQLELSRAEVNAQSDVDGCGALIDNESSQMIATNGNSSQVNTGGRNKKSKAPKVSKTPHIERPMQMSFFQLDDPTLLGIREQLKGIDINNLTPIEALNKLNEIKNIAGL